MKKKILIIGASGFIGTNCLKYFQNKKKYKIYTLTKSKQSYSKDVNQIVVDLINYKKLEKKLNNISFNFVINTSLYVDHEIDHQKGFRLLNYNLKCTYNLIFLLNKSKLEKYIHIGSADEYANNYTKLSEDNNVKAKNYYSLSKIFINNYLILLNQLENFPVIILRPFLIYGEYQKNNRLIPYIITNGLKNKKIELSSKKTKRDFLYVDDFINAIYKAMTKKNINGEIFNISYGSSFSLEEIVKIIKSKIESLDVSYNNYRRNYDVPKIVKSANLKAKKILKWKVNISINTGLIKTINFYRKFDGKY